jgi:AraC-like DNA-binding protein
MFYHEYPPPPALSPYIQCFWTLEHDYTQPFHDHEHLWADTHVECIFSFGERYYTPRYPLPQNFILGPLTKQLLLYSNGVTSFIAVRFHPGGLAAFTTHKATDLPDNILPIAKVLPEQTIALAENLQNQTREAKLQLLTQHFQNLLPSSVPTDLQNILALTSTLKTHHGMQKIADLAKQFDINPRKLERHFLQYIGLPAKLFARILRFNHAKDLINQNPDIPLAALAYETGYADQAHFSKNFRQLFNLSPAQFKAQIKKFRTDTKGQGHDVVFIQD